MRVLAINQFYAPDLAATAQLLTQLCEDLASQGDDVTVIASRGSYLGGGRLPAREQLNGVEVVRPWATRLGKASIAHRMADYLSFWASAVAKAVTERRPDVILVLTTPPMIAAGAAAVARLRSIPLVTWVQDVYPEVAVEFGVLRPGHPLVRVFNGLNTATHRSARFSVALSEGMAQRLEKQGQPREKIRIVHNWSDGQAVRPVAAADNAFRREQGLADRFVVMYSGNLGVGHDLATLIEAARALETSHPQVVFLFVGQGGRRAEAERLAEGLSNVRFLPYQPFERLSESLSAADLHLASLRPGLDGLLVPSKLYGVLAAGRPLLYVGPAACEVSRVITENEVGWACRPGEHERLTKLIAAAADTPEQCAERGRRARQRFETTFDRPHAVRRWRAVLAEAADDGL